MEWIKQNKGFLALITFSIIWCSGALWLLSSKMHLDILYIEMDLNELGDYLAGAFSPLAFLWLVYGYFMQNKELKATNLSLTAQIDAYKKSLNLSTEIFNHEIQTEKNSFIPIFVLKNAILNNESIKLLTNTIFDKNDKKNNALEELKKIKSVKIEFEFELKRHECFNLTVKNPYSLHISESHNLGQLEIGKEIKKTLLINNKGIIKLAKEDILEIPFSYEKENGVSHEGNILIQLLIQGGVVVAIESKKYEH